jgi:hypothetical protein
LPAPRLSGRSEIGKETRPKDTATGERRRESGRPVEWDPAQAHPKSKLIRSVQAAGRAQYGLRGCRDLRLCPVRVLEMDENAGRLKQPSKPDTIHRPDRQAVGGIDDKPDFVLLSDLQP